MVMFINKTVFFNFWNQEENYEQEKRIKTLTYMVEKLKEELSSKEDLLMNGKRGKCKE